MATLFEQVAEILEQLRKTRWQDADPKDAHMLLDVDFVEAARNPELVARIVKDHIHNKGFTPRQKRRDLPESLNGDAAEALLAEALGNARAPSPDKVRPVEFMVDNGQIHLIALDPEQCDRKIASFQRNLNLLAEDAKKDWKPVKSETGVEEYEHPCRDMGQGWDWCLAVMLSHTMGKKTVRITNVYPDGKEIPREPGSGSAFPDDESRDLALLRLLGTEEQSNAAAHIQRERKAEDERLDKEILKGTRTVIRIAKTEETTRQLKELIGLDMGGPGRAPG